MDGKLTSILWICIALILSAWAVQHMPQEPSKEQYFVTFAEGLTSPMRVLTDRAKECCGNREYHEYELYLALENIDHSKTWAKSPQSNGVCERFHKTVLDEFYRVAFRKKVYNSLEELQRDLDLWFNEYNEERPHSGKHCCGKTPNAAFPEYASVGESKNAGWRLTDSCVKTGRIVRYTSFAF